MPHNSLQTSCLALAVAVALLVQADPALAQFNSTELGCRASIAKQGSKVVTTAAKVFAKCHKKRAAGKLSALLMCNTESDADTSGKIDKASTKLAANIATRCAGLVPGDLLYDDCPAPCDVAVPALNNFTDVADCLICTLEGEAAALSTTLRGDPAPPWPSRTASALGRLKEPTRR